MKRISLIPEVLAMLQKLEQRKARMNQPAIEFRCFRCNDGNTPLYCLNCANEMLNLTTQEATQPQPLHWRTEPPDRPGWWLYYSKLSPAPDRPTFFNLSDYHIKNMAEWPNSIGLWFGPIEKPDEVVE